MTRHIKLNLIIRNQKYSRNAGLKYLGRVRITKYMQLANCASTLVIFPLNAISNSTDDFRAFQLCNCVLAFLAMLCFLVSGCVCYVCCVCVWMCVWVGGCVGVDGWVWYYRCKALNELPAYKSPDQHCTYSGNTEKAELDKIDHEKEQVQVESSNWKLIPTFMKML